MTQLLPDKARRSLTRAKIKSGSIIHLFCDFITPPHNKFVVVAHIDDADDFILVFFINSTIRPFIEKDPIQKACQVKLLQSRYSFLGHDSYINCAKVIDSFSNIEVIDHLVHNPDDNKGVLLDEEIIEVIQAVNMATTITEDDKRIIIESLAP